MTGAPKVSLTEVDAEMALVGSLIAYPDAARANIDLIDRAWFSDSILQRLFDVAVECQRGGHAVSYTALMAGLPPDLKIGDIGRGEFVGRLMEQATMPSAISGAAAVLRDRWARRRVVEAAQVAGERARTLGDDPFMAATETIGALDAVVALRADTRPVLAADAAGELIAKIDAGERLTGVTTGLAALDNKINGYVPGHVYVIAGRPGMGKSAFACSSLRMTAAAGHGVAFFSMEMTEREVAARMLSDAIDRHDAPGFGDLFKGKVHASAADDLRLARDSMDGLPLLIDATPSLTVQELIGRARNADAKFKAQGHKLALVCVDHLTELQPSERYAGQPVMEVSEAIKRIRVAAKQLDCAFLVLCQLSRQVEGRNDRRPMLSDLRWTGEIEQAAHVVAFLYREHYYTSQDPSADPFALQAQKHTLEFLVRKNRQGEQCDITLWCDMAHSSVRDWHR